MTRFEIDAEVLCVHRFALYSGDGTFVPALSIGASGSTSPELYYYCHSSDWRNVSSMISAYSGLQNFYGIFVCHTYRPVFQALHIHESQTLSFFLQINLIGLRNCQIVFFLSQVIFWKCHRTIDIVNQP